MQVVQADVASDEFVNPYSFVRIPKDLQEGTWRCPPAGHDRLAEGRISGELEVELTARSPLMLRNVYAGKEECFPRRRIPGFEQEVPYIPGSSLAGSVRSLHETISAGCLRIFDEGFLPGYRDQPVAREVRDPKRGKDWRLAVVRRVDTDGAPTRLELCEETVWVEVSLLHRALKKPENLRTGATVDVEAPTERTGPEKRLELKEPDAKVRAGRSSVVLVTDFGGRRKDRQNPEGKHKPKLKSRYFCATGKLRGTVSEAVVPVEVWADFQTAAEGSRDVQQARQDEARGETPEPLLPVHHSYDNEFLGYRTRARRELCPGDVVWLQHHDGEGEVTVESLALAVLWRHQGEGPAGERVPEHLIACSDPRSLCPSCRLFGAVDATSEDGTDGEARQRAYRGHVRFSDAVPLEEYETEEQLLPGLGAPRPGAGQFYLTRSDRLERDSAREEVEAPHREWGASPDHGRYGPRPLRGRKHYWLTGQADQRPYFRAREQQGKNVFHELAASKDGKAKTMLSRAESVPKDAQFTTRVAFENLSEAELGGLLAALDPGLLLHEYDEEGERPQYGWAVGGGRPLGFGTCTSTVRIVSLDSAESRYLGQEAPVIDAVRAVRAFVKTATSDQRAIWKKVLARVLRLDWAPAEKVWYPPAGVLPGPDGSLDPKALRASFAFWRETSGGWTRGGGFPYQQLPAANSPSLGMKVIPDTKERGR